MIARGGPGVNLKEERQDMLGGEREEEREEGYTPSQGVSEEERKGIILLRAQH